MSRCCFSSSHLVLGLVFAMSLTNQSDAVAQRPMRLGIIGLTHTHVYGILGRRDRGDIKIVGIVEPNEELADRYLKHFGLAKKLYYPTVDKLLASVEVDAVAAFGSTFEHLEVVEFFAPRGIHVMVEKPLAVNLNHAEKMAALARKHEIELLTNYETTWYASNHRAFQIVEKDKQIGELRRIVVHSGHRGPQEIGVNEEFLDWLTDPEQNGGGAITDFGCYGVNLINWLTDNERPESITAVLQTIKPTVYPDVDDEATIVLRYPEMQGVVQASWNWPISRKDMEIYGATGQIFCRNQATIEYRLDEQKPQISIQLPSRESPFDDPFSYFAAVVAGKVNPQPRDLSSLENNLLVVEILDAAIRSSKLRKTVEFDQANHR